MSDAADSAAALDRLIDESHRFSFFQAVRLLELVAARDGKKPAPLGHQGPPEREAVRLRPSLSLAFPHADIESIQRLPDSEGMVRHELTTTFLGIYGVSSPLPTYVTEFLMAQDENSLARGFIDLFHHRILSLFYRILGKYRCAAPHPGAHGDSFQWRLQTLLGVTDRATDSPADVRGAFLLGYAGLIAQQPRSADTLLRVLSDYFPGIPVAIEQCVPRWTSLPIDQRNRLGHANSTLGRDCLAGDAIYNRVTAFRLGLGPLRWSDQQAFLPGGGRHGELKQLVSLFNDNGLDYEVELSVIADDLPCLPLGDARARLGYATRAAGTDQAHYRMKFLVTG